jgi:hypothetical protein
MTERDQRLTEHLAGLCGLVLFRHCAECPEKTLWTKTPREDWVAATVVFEFVPITDPRDTAIVMEAWAKQDDGDREWHSRPYTLIRVFNDHGLASVTAGREWFDTTAPSWTKAVCEAIGAASGYNREGE